MRELEEENKKLNERLQLANKEAEDIKRQAEEQAEKMKREAKKQAKEEAEEIKRQAEKQARKEAEEIKREAKKQAEEIMRQTEENQNLRAELDKLRQSKQAEQRAENIKRQLAEQHVKDIENIRAESEQRAKQQAEQLAKKIEELQAELELRQQNTAATDVVLGAPALGLLPPSSAFTTANSDEVDSGSPAGFAGTDGIPWGFAPTPKIPELDPDFDMSDAADAASAGGGPETQSRVSSPPSTPLDSSPSSPSQNATDFSDPGIDMPDPSNSDIDMSDAADAAFASGNPGVQTSPDSPTQHTVDPSGFGIDMPDIADTGAASAGDNTVVRPSSSSPDSSPSSPAQHPADTPGLGVGIPDTADAVSASKTIIDVDALELQGPRSILTMPNFKGPYSKRLDTMIKWGNVQFPKIGFNEFGDGRFIRAGVFHELSTKHSWFVTEHSQTHPLSKAGISETNPSKVHPLLNAVQSGKYSFAVVLCPVRLGPEDPVNHFVVAIVDWREEGRNLHGGSRRGRSEKKSGKFTHWGMDMVPGLAETLRNDCEQILGLGLESCEKKLTYTGNTCLLQCFRAVLSYEGKACPKADDDPSAIRVFFLQKQLERLVSQNNEAVSRGPQDNSCGHTTADTETATAEGLLAACLPKPATQHGDEATIEDLGGDGSTLQHPQSAGSFSSAQFALLGKKQTRTPLPSKPPPKTKARAASPLPSDPGGSAPPPPSGQGINSPATHQGVKYQWMPCDGGQVLVLHPTPDQYSDLKEGPEDGSPLLFSVAEELGARTQGAFLINTPEECRPVLPPQTVQKKPCSIYTPVSIKDDFWRLYNETATRSLPSSDHNPSNVDFDLGAVIDKYEGRILEGMRGVSYLTDIPAHSIKEREYALLPPESQIWHIRGNRLPREGVPGLHTPTAYRGTEQAPFAWHFEDYKLGALNYLYYGQKVWYVIQPKSCDKASRVFSNVLEVKADHDQFMRHQALHCGINHLRRSDVPTMGFMQEAWQMVVVYPGAYHSGFSVTPTLAEAVNYADLSYTVPEGYKPCNKNCQGYDPITLKLVFPPEAKTIPASEKAGTASEEAGFSLRRSLRKVATSHPAPASGSMGSPKPLQKRRRSTCEGGSARHERAETQNKLRDKSQDEAMSEPQGTPENDSTVEPDETRVKRKKRDIQDLADAITGQHAKKRFRAHVLAWIDNQVLGLLPKQNSNPFKEPHEYLDAGWRLQAQGPFLKFVGLTFTTHGIEKMYSDEITPGLPLPKLLNGAMETAMTALECNQLNAETFRKKLAKDRTFVKLGVSYLAFIPVSGDSSDPGAATFADFHTLSNAEIKELCGVLARSPKAQEIVQVGRGFRESILQGDFSVWTGSEAERIREMGIDEFWEFSLRMQKGKN
ncbi:hypothetical protein RB596_009106 [Gaeumannomyces avenae]